MLFYVKFIKFLLSDERTQRFCVNFFDVDILQIVLGIMAGMSRDKCGSGVVAGFLQCVAKLKPKGIKVVGGMAMVSHCLFIALFSLIN